MLRVNSPSFETSIVCVPHFSARYFPPFRASSRQYALIFSSPPSHARNCSAPCMLTYGVWSTVPFPAGPA